MELYFHPEEKGMNKHDSLSIESKQREITDYMDYFISKPENILSMIVSLEILVEIFTLYYGEWQVITTDHHR